MAGALQERDLSQQEQEEEEQCLPAHTQMVSIEYEHVHTHLRLLWCNRMLRRASVGLRDHWRSVVLLLIGVSHWLHWGSNRSCNWSGNWWVVSSRLEENTLSTVSDQCQDSLPSFSSVSTLVGHSTPLGYQSQVSGCGWEMGVAAQKWVEQLVAETQLDS